MALAGERGDGAADPIADEARRLRRIPSRLHSGAIRCRRGYTAYLAKTPAGELVTASAIRRMEQRVPGRDEMTLAVIDRLVHHSTIRNECRELSTVLWNGGISFGGVVAFIFADLIVLPVLDICRRYYRLKMAAFIFVGFYAAMAGAALIVEAMFGAAGLIPMERRAIVAEATWNYTTWLNRMMNRPMEAHHGHHA
jgi:uncharacterized membrane protein YraQ (UPF0718 family)